MAAKSKPLREHADRIFNKRFTLKSKDDSYSLPCIDAMYSTGPFEVASLMTMRDELNRIKSLLDDKDIEEWRRHTSQTNPTGLVVKNLRSQFNPELCTQAWAKFYEIVSTFDVIPAKCLEKKRLNSFHLCEAPGAFITSLNHYIKCRFEEIEWNWLASSLNPFYEGNDTKRMIEAEKFIVETEEHWNFGDSYDGDIMNWKNLEHLQHGMENLGKADIVTADGSISCADKPEKQETTIGQLLYCEAITALTLLAPGGSLVLKIFTMFEHHTICLLYLLCCFFTEVHIVKPGTSKAGNSEVYCVCTAFVGVQHMSKELLEKLQSYYSSQPSLMSLFSQDLLPKNFMESIVDCARTFTEYQKNAITRNIEFYENFSKGRRKFVHNLRKYIAEEYVRRFDVTFLDERFFVVAHTHLSGSQLSFWPELAEDFWHHSGHQTGCYQHRMEMTRLGWHDRVVFPQAEMRSFISEKELIEDIIRDEPVHWLSCPSSHVSKLDVDSWSFRLGKSITRVESSRFCYSSLIGELNEARMSANVLQTPEGQHLIERVEQVARQKLSVVSNVSVHSNTVNVLRNCDLLSGSSKLRFIDISGNCRYIMELNGSDVAKPVHCIGLLCQLCTTQSSRDESILKFDGVTVNSCRRCEDGVTEGINNLASGANDSVTVICGSVFKKCRPLHSRCDELSCRPAFVNQCLTALKFLKDGDSFVCEIVDTLTQFTVGIIYILHQFFKEISFHPLANNLRSSPKQFLVCRSYLSSKCNVDLIPYIGRISEVLESKLGEKDVISVVPIRKLFSEDFYKYIRARTTKHVEAQLNCIVNLERLWLTKKYTA